MQCSTVFHCKKVGFCGKGAQIACSRVLVGQRGDLYGAAFQVVASTVAVGDTHGYRSRILLGEYRIAADAAVAGKGVGFGIIHRNGGGIDAGFDADRLHLCLVVKHNVIACHKRGGVSF